MSEAPRGKLVTPAYLERAAVAYLERFASSSAHLRRVLVRKAARRAGAAPEGAVLAAIDETVAKAIRSGLVDDRAYAQTKLAGLARRGASPSGARLKLAAKGLDRDTVDAALLDADLDEAAQARLYARRKRLGPFRVPADPERRERDLAALARAGFGYRAAAAALDEPPIDGLG